MSFRGDLAQGEFSSGVQRSNIRDRQVGIIHATWYGMWTRIVISSLLVASIGCVSNEEPAPVERDWALEHAEQYLEDREFRRAQLEASLWRPDLPYARKRLAGYALPDGGWDLLPKITTEVTTVGENPTTIDLLEGDTVPQTRAEWLALGEQVFWSMPMRRDSYLEWLVDKPEHWDAVGLQRDDDGNVRGIVRFTDARGNQRAGATCGLCHGDAGLPGQATRELDLGLGRELFSNAVYGRETDYDTWGKGRVDVTDDQVIDALAIPDLWGVRHQAYMNHSGAIKLETPAALAIRFETQYVVGHSMEARPDRRLSWALMMYVYSLEPPATNHQATARGEELFEERCASCHVPELGYSGHLIPTQSLGSDPQAANSRLRGTGAYKASSLIRIADGAPYLHDASVSSLQELVRQHPTASDLSDDDIDELIGFLETL